MSAFSGLVHGVPHPPPYDLVQDEDGMLIYEGQLELGSGAAAVRGDGAIRLLLTPVPRFEFTIADVPVQPNVTQADRLRLPSLVSDLDAHVSRLNMGPRGLVGGAAVGTIGDAEAAVLSEVRFFVLDLPLYVGDSLETVDERGTSYWRGRLPLETDGWLIDLDLRRDHDETYKRLDNQGGFEITHIGSLRRSDGTLFSGSQAEAMLDSLGQFLGFAAGGWAPPIAAIGFADDGAILYRELKRRWTSPWRSRLWAFDRHHSDELIAGFAGYAGRSRDPVWTEPLLIATQLYVEANSPVTVDTSLVLAQNVLELIAWVRFVEDLKTVSEQDFDGKGVRASDRVREALSWMHVDPTIPATALPALVEAAKKETWADGPHAICEMRNALIHPRQRRRLTATPSRARIELQELALWYVELAMLRLIDFNGNYSNRLGAKATGVVEPVPWQTP